MDTIIAKIVFETSGGDLVAKVDARVVELSEVVQEFSFWPERERVGEAESSPFFFG